ncbi:histone-lysine N-methyltransferase SETMAR [Trichonephila clavipes]|nr:histone-lysine N-methyltransferase SETMAR [Trichonephila clavipes]
MPIRRDEGRVVDTPLVFKRGAFSGERRRRKTKRKETEKAKKREERERVGDGKREEKESGERERSRPVHWVYATPYCDTLSKLKEVIRKKQPGLLGSGVWLGDSATATQNHIATLGWKRLHHPPYSPDLAPRDSEGALEAMLK